MMSFGWTRVREKEKKKSWSGFCLTRLVPYYFLLGFCSWILFLPDVPFFFVVEKKTFPDLITPLNLLSQRMTHILYVFFLLLSVMIFTWNFQHQNVFLNRNVRNVLNRKWIFFLLPVNFEVQWRFSSLIRTSRLSSSLFSSLSSSLGLCCFYRENKKVSCSRSRQQRSITTKIEMKREGYDCETRQSLSKTNSSKRNETNSEEKKRRN